MVSPARSVTTSVELRVGERVGLHRHQSPAPLVAQYQRGRSVPLLFEEAPRGTRAQSRATPSRRRQLDAVRVADGAVIAWPKSGVVAGSPRPDTSGTVMLRGRDDARRGRGGVVLVEHVLRFTRVERRGALDSTLGLSPASRQRWPSRQRGSLASW